MFMRTNYDPGYRKVRTDRNVVLSLAESTRGVRALIQIRTQ